MFLRYKDSNGRHKIDKLPTDYIVASPKYVVFGMNSRLITGKFNKHGGLKCNDIASTAYSRKIVCESNKCNGLEYGDMTLGASERVIKMALFPMKMMNRDLDEHIIAQDISEANEYDKYMQVLHNALFDVVVDNHWTDVSPFTLTDLEEEITKLLNNGQNDDLADAWNYMQSNGADYLSVRLVQYD